MRLCYIILLLFSGLLLQAQEEADFRQYGQMVYQDLIEEGRWDRVEMIRLRTYRSFIEEKVVGESRKLQLINEGDAHLLNQHEKLQLSLHRLLQRYAGEENPATTHYIGSYHFPREDSELPDTYTMVVSFLYEEGEMQSEVRLQFDVVWYLDYFFLLGDISENF